MSWVPTLLPWQWAILAAVPIGIVLLYFLKLRREPVEVPSTFLWMRTIEDLHVNSLLQRLRRSLLLLLQLLAVAIAALALLRPGLRGETTGQGRSVFLLDTSASMQATDVKDASNRFEQARRMIGERIETMTDRETAMLVTFSDRPEVLQSFTSDRRRLREALARAKLTNRPTDLLGALKAADGLANPRRTSEVGNTNDVQVAEAMPADLFLYSDGGFQPVTEFDLGNLVPKYVPIGSPDVKNLAITAFSAERNVERPTEIQAFATIVNLGSAPSRAVASLSIDGEFRDASSVSLDPGEQSALSFALDQEETVSLKLELQDESGDRPLQDDLAIDNVAFAGLLPMRTVSVLVVTPGNTPLELGLSTEKAAQVCQPEFVSPSFLETDDYRQRAASARDDLIIFDRCAPKEMPLTNTFFIGSLPSEGWSWDSEPGTVVLIDLDRTHPIMRYLDLYSLLIFRGRAVKGPAGSFVLVAGDSGPILTLAPRDGYQDMVLGFEIITTDPEGASQTNTNWFAERSWPVFVLNMLRYLAGAAESSGAPSFRPDETVRLRLESATREVTVGREAARRETVTVGPSGVTEIVATSEPGNYRVEAGDRLVDLFAINLFDRRESDLAVTNVNLGYESLSAVFGNVEEAKEYWRPLLLVMLAILAIEWWVYSRRIA